MPYNEIAVEIFFSDLLLNYQIYIPHDAQAIYFFNNILYVAGQTRHSVGGVAYTSLSQYDVIVSKYDTLGKLIESVVFGGNDQDTPADILVHPITGEIFVCGTTLSTSIANSTSHGSNDAFVAKLDSNLNLLWVRLFGYQFDDYALTVSLHSNNRIYMAVQMNSTGMVSNYGVVSFDSALVAPVIIMSSNIPSTFEPPAESTTIDNFIMTVSFNDSTKPTPVSKKNLVISQKLSKETPSYYWLIVIGIGLVLFFILIFILSRIYFNLSNRNTDKNSSSFNTTTTGTDFGQSCSSYSSSLQPTTSATTSTFNDILTTQMVTQNAYSIPGYLQMNNEEFRPLNEIAKGGQGTISVAEVLNSQFVQQYKVKQVIIKSTELNFDQLNERKQNGFNQEMAIIHFFKESPGFVRLYGYTLKPAALIMKFYPLSNMENLIKRTGSFVNLITNRRFIILFSYQLSNTILLLHEAGFVHSDLKPQNILLEADQRGQLHPILTDFGITQIVSSKVLKVKAMAVENLKGFSLYYAAPEQIEQMRGKNYKSLSPDLVKKRDIYALSGILYGLLTNREPWL